MFYSAAVLKMGRKSLKRQRREEKMHFMREQKRLKNSIQLKENLNPGSKSVCSEILSGAATSVTDIGDLTQV